MPDPPITQAAQEDVARYGRKNFLDVDLSIRLYERLGRPGGNWQKWEWPRRLAALEAGKAVQEVMPI